MPKVRIPPLKKGKLSSIIGGRFSEIDPAEIGKKLAGAVKRGKLSARSAYGKLIALLVFNKNRNPKIANHARQSISALKTAIHSQKEEIMTYWTRLMDSEGK